MARLLTLLLLVVSSHALAEDWVQTWCCSYHWERTRRDSGEPYNERNHGIGLVHVLPSGNALLAGNFDNSFSRRSSYVGFEFRGWRFDSGLQWEPGLAIGGVSGYGTDPREQQKLKPMYLPMLHGRFRWWGVDLSLDLIGIPGLIGALGLSWRVP